MGLIMVDITFHVEYQRLIHVDVLALAMISIDL